jgi:hypothetical protein
MHEPTEPTETPRSAPENIASTTAPTAASKTLSFPEPQSGQSVLCPFCRGRDTELLSSFGSQLSTEQHYCRSCRTPFEYMRPEEDTSR